MTLPSDESEQRFRKIFDHSNDAILIVDVIQDEILDANSRASEMLGYDRRELLSTPVSAIHPNEMPRLLDFAKSVSSNGQGWTDELTCLTKSGQFLPAEISASFIEIHGRSCMIALVRDISQRRQAEERLQRANDRMRRDLEAAARVQESLLPQAPLDLPGLNVAWAFNPCDELAGDIFDVYPFDERCVGLYILDVSGHGVVSALLSVTLNRVLSPEPSLPSILKQHIGNSKYRLLSPSEVAEQLNCQFPLDPERPQYFTLLFGILDLEAEEFRYVAAGHSGPIHQSTGTQTVALETPGFPIGLFDQVDWEQHRLRINRGDRLYLYSDGVTEAKNKQGEELGRERLVRRLDSTRNQTLEDSVASLLRSVDEWRAGTRLEDDVSVLAVEILD